MLVGASKCESPHGQLIKARLKHAPLDYATRSCEYAYTLEASDREHASYYRYALTNGPREMAMTAD